MSQLTIPIEGEDDVIVQLRDERDRMKSWERRGLYETFDRIEGGVAVKELNLMRIMSAHIIRSWSLPMDPPSVHYVPGGEIVYKDLDCWDDLDADVEGAILEVCGPWVTRLKLNFQPSKDPQSPTKPVDA